ncbi:hypothetical protein ES703_114239 [subsurface metagenome]
MLLGALAIKVQPPSGKEKGRVDKAEVTKQVSPELERAAARRARDRANDARWNLDVAIFLFAIVIIVIILSFQGIRIEIVAPIATFGLAMAWLVGWRQGRQLYERFYDEELSAGEIVVICAWCGKEMRRERGLGQSIVSHGICSECVQKNFPEILTQHD